MGHRDYYVCLDCERLDSLSIEEGVDWMENHWGHRALIAWTADGELSVSILQEKGETE